MSAIRRLLPGPGKRDRCAFGRFRILDALYQVGDHRVIADALPIALEDVPDDYDRSCAIELLTRHPPLRQALGFDGWNEDEDGPICILDDDAPLFFRAVDEWYHDDVLRKPSPHRPPAEPGFGEPCAMAKRAAWRTLAQGCESEGDPYAQFRAWPSDPVVTDADAWRTVTVTRGSGHGGDLEVLVFRPAATGVRCHRLEHQGPSIHRSMEERGMGNRYATAWLSPTRYLELVAGVRTILEAKLVRWWSGPGMGCLCSTGNFAIAFTGLGADPTDSVGFCGYPSSDDLEQRLRPVAARAWLDEFLAAHATFEPAGIDADARQAFAEAGHLRQAEAVNDAWWVKERWGALGEGLGEARRSPPDGSEARTQGAGR